MAAQNFFYLLLVLGVLENEQRAEGNSLVDQVVLQHLCVLGHQWVLSTQLNLEAG